MSRVTLVWALHAGEITVAPWKYEIRQNFFPELQLAAGA